MFTSLLIYALVITSCIVACIGAPRLLSALIFWAIKRVTRGPARR